ATLASFLAPAPVARGAAGTGPGIVFTGEAIAVLPTGGAFAGPSLTPLPTGMVTQPAPRTEEALPAAEANSLMVRARELLVLAVSEVGQALRRAGVRALALAGQGLDQVAALSRRLAALPMPSTPSTGSSRAIPPGVTATATAPNQPAEETSPPATPRPARGGAVQTVMLAIVAFALHHVRTRRLPSALWRHRRKKFATQSAVSASHSGEGTA